MTPGHRLLVIALLAWTGLSKAETPQPLELEEVLATSREHFPRILQSLAAQRRAAGKIREAEGSFDLVFEADGFSRVTGFYDGIAGDVTASQPFRNLGGKLYSGYKISNGTFPIYEDEYYTNSGGALRVGALFSLLRDRETDERRFGITDAKLSRREADLEVLLTHIGVQQRALLAYWRWIAAGRQVSVYQSLLGIATERQAGLERQVQRGAVAEIFLTENQQNMVRRQTLVTAALRDLSIAANALSLYYRNSDGRPVAPGPERLPPEDLLQATSPIGVLPAVATSQALERRPELNLLRTTFERVQGRIDLAENQLQPRLDFGIEVQTPFGAVAEGGPSRDQTDTVIGFEFSVPFQNRAARGRLDQARAELDEIEYERRLTQEQIELEVRNILLEYGYARALLNLASQEMTQSEMMRDAELRRFESGASDFFLVNVREESAADARVRYYQAELTARAARANYDAAVVDVVRLGIEGAE